LGVVFLGLIIKFLIDMVGVGHQRAQVTIEDLFEIFYKLRIFQKAHICKIWTTGTLVMCKK
jgi:hypothetical protein